MAEGNCARDEGDRPYIGCLDLIGLGLGLDVIKYPC